MRRSQGKRAYHRKQMEDINRRALTIGFAVASIILLVIVGSVIW